MQTPGAPQPRQVDSAQNPQNGDISVEVGDSGANLSLAQGRSQSQDDLDQTAIEESAQSAVSDDPLQLTIARAEASIITLVKQAVSDDAKECTPEQSLEIDLAGVAGVDRLVALEAMALQKLSALVKYEFVPLTKTEPYSAQSHGELNFTLENSATQDQEADWECRYGALDEAVLRLVGTTGSNQTYKGFQRVASLEMLVARAAAKGETWQPSASIDEVGAYRAQAASARARKLLPILTKNRDFADTQQSWLLRAAKLEEVILEALGFNPMKRSVVVQSAQSD